MDKLSKIMWSYIISKGSIVEDESYYGATTNYTKADECRKLLLKYELDFDKMKPLTDDNADRFVGTFHDSEEVCYLRGTAYLTDGSKWEWYMEYDSLTPLLEFMSDMLEDL